MKLRSIILRVMPYRRDRLRPISAESVPVAEQRWALGNVQPSASDFASPGGESQPACKALKGVWPGIVLTLLSAFPVFSTTITVTNTNDSGTGSLRAAIGSAAAGDTISFALPLPATIALNTPLTLGTNVTISGPDASNLAISGGDSVVVFIINAGATVTISGVTITHGSSLLGGGIFNGGTLTLTGCTVSANTMGTQFGGGIFNSGALTLSNSTVSANGVGVVGGFGGGMYNYHGTVTLTNSTFSDNFALPAEGGGMYNDHGTVTLTNSTFSFNFGNEVGGMYNDHGTVTVIKSIFDNNFGIRAGGIYNGDSAELTVTNSTFSRNGSNSSGAIKNIGRLTVINSTFWSNGGFASAAIVNLNTVTLKNSILANSGNVNCSYSPESSNTSEGHNLSDDASCAGFFTQTGDLNSTPAGLDPGGLKDNGGPTQTIALLPTSAAVNAIPLSPTNYCTSGRYPIKTDQRGVLRPQGPRATSALLNSFNLVLGMKPCKLSSSSTRCKSCPSHRGRSRA